jgi:DNA-binding LacI/PurR family transcriptional regulator
MTDRPTGLCIVNDYVAFAFMVDVMRAGWRVPEQISIIGHDNRDIASRCPVPLTSVTQPITQITEAVVRMLRERLNGFEGAARRLVVRGELVERDSIAPPQHGD